MLLEGLLSTVGRCGRLGKINLLFLSFFISFPKLCWNFGQSVVWGLFVVTFFFFYFDPILRYTALDLCLSFVSHFYVSFLSAGVGG